VVAAGDGDVAGGAGAGGLPVALGCGRSERAAMSPVTFGTVVGARPPGNTAAFPFSP
jgi:hypothetical protein